MLYSKTTEYTLRALSYLSSQKKGEFTGAREVSKRTGVPYAYIAKILRALGQNRILDSSHGRTGGFALREGLNPSLMDIITAVDNTSESPFSNCVMGLAVCGNKNPCILHTLWVESAKKMKKRLQQARLSDILPLNGRFSAGKGRRRTLARMVRNIFAPKSGAGKANA